MSGVLTEIFVCPDDRGDLKTVEGYLVCKQCNRSYKILAPNLVELLPSSKVKREGQSELEIKNIQRYEKIFDEKFSWDNSEAPWGHVSSLPKKTQGRVLRQSNLIKRILPEKLGIFCDISAGSGRYDFEIIDRCSMAVLSDLRVADSVHLYKEAKERATPNVLIVRCDYLKSPYRADIFDTILCNDTLIYGREHECRLLKTIYKSLKNGGIALVDFHNRRHTGFWHIPYEIGYTLNEIKQLLKLVGIKKYEVIPFYQERFIRDNNTMIQLLWKAIIPPTRYFVKIVKVHDPDEYPALS